MARRMWSKHDLLRLAGVEITGEDTMKRMWSKHDLLRLVGAEITDEDEDTMKRMWSRDELIDLLSNLDPEDPDPNIPARYVQTTTADFDANGDYIGTEEYIILPADKQSGYRIQNINVKGVATDGDYLTSCQNMFNGNPSLYLELDYLDTSNVTTMANMFWNSQATTLDLSSFDTSKVTNMNSMFNGSQATTLDLSSFDTSNVTNMGYMFSGSQATTLDLSSFDTSNVTNMSNMFYYSKATIGYARTQADADNFNSSSNKPSTLNFVVK